MEKARKITVQDLDVAWVAWLLQQWSLEEFVELIMEKNIDGKKLLPKETNDKYIEDLLCAFKATDKSYIDISEGLVKLWRPRSNAKKFMTFVEDIKSNPYKYLQEINDIVNNNNKMVNQKKVENQEKEKHEEKEKNKRKETNIKTVEDMTTTELNKVDVAAQYQIITIKKKDESVATLTTEEIIQQIVPHKSFLYRHQQTLEILPSYLPMDSGTPKKSKLLKTNSYDYPLANIKCKLFKKEYSYERAYCPMERSNKFYSRSNKSRYKWFRRSVEPSQIYPDDHFYEDLCFNEDNSSNTKKKIFQSRRVSVSCILKIQGLFQNFRVPFLKKTVSTEKKHLEKDEPDLEDTLYENNESIAEMYDSIIVDCKEPSTNGTQYHQLPVEDYLVPVKLSKEYCDIKLTQKDESIMKYILNIFGNNFKFKRETKDDQQLSDSETKIGSSVTEEISPEEHNHGHTNMAARPLPVPVENEQYYVNISREEAENLLQGQPNGTFILRPSSQSEHVYTLSIACAQRVHNVGIRRRPDGKLALGYPRRGEASFWSITSLIEYHQKKRLLLVVEGNVIGATTLIEPPMHYQVPKSYPMPVIKM